jgi:DNA (cytosine-5)-methyltransferase 1
MGDRLSAVSLFSGCGGFDWGATQAGLNVIWANDNDPYAAVAYKSIFPQVEFVEGDVRKIMEFPKADVLIGCYPCTGFSVAARRRWHDLGERNLMEINGNFLYEEFIRALDIVQPKYLFVENVRGMKSAEDGWFYKKQIEGFKSKGYKITTNWLNAANFGVPQTRLRLFIVGVKNCEDVIDYKFPKPTNGIEFEKSIATLKSAISEMPLWPTGEYFDYPFHGHFLTRNRKRNWDQPSYTIVANAHHVPLHPMGDPMIYIGKDKWALQGNENRRLSWRECAKIQGLPDHLAPTGGIMDKYRVVGNAVPPKLGEVLVKPIIDWELSTNLG